MAVPKFWNFLYPFLSHLKDGDVSKNDMRRHLVDHFKLTEEDCSRRTRSNRVTQLDDRIGWSLQYLRRARLVEIPERGTYRITSRGLDYLNTHDDLQKEDLMQFKEFSEFVNGKKDVDPVPVERRIHFEETTPTEQLENAFLDIQNDLIDEILDRIQSQSPSFFEHLVMDLLLKMGYGNPADNLARVTPKVHDDGIDGIIPQDKLGLDKIYFQAKRYGAGNIVGKPLIQGFVGALDEQKADKGVFITTSAFSKEARAYIGKTTKKIVLIDGNQLARYMIEYNVGVATKKIYEVKRIDSDYFDE